MEDKKVLRRIEGRDLYRFTIQRHKLLWLLAACHFSSKIANSMASGPLAFIRHLLWISITMDWHTCDVPTNKRKHFARPSLKSEDLSSRSEAMPAKMPGKKHRIQSTSSAGYQMLKHLAMAWGKWVLSIERRMLDRKGIRSLQRNMFLSFCRIWLEPAWCYT